MPKISELPLHTDTAQSDDLVPLVDTNSTVTVAASPAYIISRGIGTLQLQTDTTSSDTLIPIYNSSTSQTESASPGYVVAEGLSENAFTEGYEFLKQYKPDPDEVDQGQPGVNGKTVDDLINDIGDSPGVIVFERVPGKVNSDDKTVYVFQSFTIIPDNIKIRVSSGGLLRFEQPSNTQRGAMIMGFGGFEFANTYIIDDQTRFQNGIWWPNVILNEIRLIWWGADGKETTDSSPAFNAGVNAIPLGGTIDLDFGFYRLTKTVKVPNNLQIRGKGTETQIVVDTYTSTQNGGDPEGFSIKDKENVTFSDFFMRANNENMEGIKFDNVPNAKTQNIELNNMSKGIRFEECDSFICDRITASANVDDVIRVEKGARHGLIRNTRATTGAGTIISFQEGRDFFKWQASNTYDTSLEWISAITYETGDIVAGKDDDGNWYEITAQNTGLSGQSEPDWTLFQTQTQIVDNEITWEQTGTISNPDPYTSADYVQPTAITAGELWKATSRSSTSATSGSTEPSFSSPNTDGTVDDGGIVWVSDGPIKRPYNILVDGYIFDGTDAGIYMENSAKINIRGGIVNNLAPVSGDRQILRMENSYSITIDGLEGFDIGASTDAAFKITDCHYVTISNVMLKNTKRLLRLKQNAGINSNILLTSSNFVDNDTIRNDDPTNINIIDEAKLMI